MSARPVVLVVEDDWDTRSMYAQCLESWGFDVLQARDGAEGVQCALSLHPHVVLMDVAMPRMDGLEATRWLRNDPATTHLPIVIVSAYTTAQDRARAMAAGADEFLSKPCDLDLVASRLRHYAGQ
jgi:two-component system, cell cycle response regulator DivK